MITHGNEIKLFSGNSNKQLAQAIAKKLNTELGEIEVNVNMIEGSRVCCCIYDKQSDKIVLFFVGEPEAKSLVSILRDKLPRYMIPNKVIKLETMPLTANGKLDRVTLKNQFEATKKEK